MEEKNNINIGETFKLNFNLNLMDYIIWMGMKGLKPDTIKHYSWYLQKYNLNSLSQTSTNDFLSTYNNNVSRAFIKNFIQYLKENSEKFSFNLEEKSYLNTINIAKQTGRKKIKLPKIITIEEVFEIEKFLHNERDKLMLLVSFYSGLRIGELLKLKPSNFFWKKFDIKDDVGEALVYGKGGKEGIALLPNQLMNRVRHWINEEQWFKIEDDEKLFEIKSRRWQNILSISSKNAIGRHINPHILRHSIATYLMQRKVDITYIKSFLRHSSIRSTEIYLHLNQDDLKKEYLKVFPEKKD